MELFSLEFLWYLVVIASLMFYAVLDGFDLGVGSLYLFARTDKERRIFLNSIGPFWDGNEVWLVIIGGALFAGFPEVFATIFSSFYVFCVLLLLGLIFRAVAIEFRSKHESLKWRKNWDGAFSAASILISFGAGLVLGNLVQGIPLDQHKDFVGTFLSFVRPYPIVFGITTVSLFSMHGAIFLLMKTEGALHEYIKSWIQRCIWFFLGCYCLLTVLTFYYAHYMTVRITGHWLLMLIPILALCFVFNIMKQVKKNNNGWAFISSCISIVLLLSLFAIGTFPILVRSNINPEQYSLVISNSASSALTLKVLLYIVVIGLPLVLGYGTYIYRIFRGKVKLDDHSY